MDNVAQTQVSRQVSNFSQFNPRILQMVWLTSFLMVLLLTGGCSSGNGEGLDGNGDPVDGEDGGNSSVFAAVQSIFTARCTQCHAGAGASAGLVLSDGLSYAAIVNVASSQQATLQLIEPGDADASYLVRKIRGTAGITGSRMPLNGPPYLSEADIATIADWADAGAVDDTLFAFSNEQFFDDQQFGDYENWQRVESTDMEADIRSSLLAVRVQLGGDEQTVFVSALPEQWGFESPHYPIGTNFVVEARIDGEVHALAAAVKVAGRDGDTEEARNDRGQWKWVRLDPESFTVLSRSY